MRARVDPSKCQGYGICVELAPRHFVFDDWGFVQSVAVDAEGDHVGLVRRAVAQCPIKAIRWVDSPTAAASVDSESGEPSAPSRDR